MNKCFLIANIVKNEGFKFIIKKKSKHKSAVVLQIKLRNGSIFKAIGYDEVADYILRQNIQSGLIAIMGKLRQDKRSRQTYIKIEYIKKLSY